MNASFEAYKHFLFVTKEENCEKKETAGRMKPLHSRNLLVLPARNVAFIYIIGMWFYDFHYLF